MHSAGKAKTVRYPSFPIRFFFLAFKRARTTRNVNIMGSDRNKTEILCNGRVKLTVLLTEPLGRFLQFIILIIAQLINGTASKLAPNKYKCQPVN